MTLPSLPHIPYEEPILIALSRLVFQWNITEGRMRSLLASFLPQNNIRDIFAASILTSEMGSRSLSDAIAAFSNDVLPQDEGEAVKHANNYFGRLSTYRNFYVHGLHMVLNTTGGPLGVIHQWSAKGSLKEHKTFVKVDDLEFVTSHAVLLARYINGIMNYRKPFSGSPPQPLPDKPPLPDQLEKPLQLMRASFPPPRSSQA